MLNDPDMKNLTVASIAYDSGFNTLSAFNTAFKKFTGLTPSNFEVNIPDSLIFSSLPFKETII